MILDNEQQRQILLELMSKASFPGEHVEIIYHLKAALMCATVLPGTEAADSTITPERAALAAHLASASD